MSTAFVYKWTHVPSGKWYIGSRTAKNCHVNDNYICSSTEVRPLIQQNPTEWIREILATGSADEMIHLEAVLLKTYDTKHDILSFNKHNGDGKFSMAGKTGGRTGKSPWNKGLTKETDSRVTEYANTLSNVNKGSTGVAPWNKGLDKTDPRIAKGIETIVSRKSRKNKCTGNDNPAKRPEVRKILSESQTGSNNSRYGKTPWNKGKKGLTVQSKESNQARSNKLSGVARSEEVKAKIRATKAANKLRKLTNE